MHRPSTTMSSSFHTYGLIGIDLHHAQSRRRGWATTTLPRPSMGTRVRHALATLCIAAGTMLAGDEAGRSPEGQPATT